MGKKLLFDSNFIAFNALRTIVIFVCLSNFFLRLPALLQVCFLLDEIEGFEILKLMSDNLGNP